MEIDEAEATPFRHDRTQLRPPWRRSAEGLATVDALLLPHDVTADEPDREEDDGQEYPAARETVSQGASLSKRGGAIELEPSMRVVSWRWSECGRTYDYTRVFSSSLEQIVPNQRNDRRTRFVCYKA